MPETSKVSIQLGRPTGLHPWRKRSTLNLKNEIEIPRRLHLLKTHTRSDDFLCAFVNACGSNVAALDESGNVLFASKAWRGFENAINPGVHQRYVTPGYFERCERIPDSSEQNVNTTLSDDIQDILVGNVREFHRKYSFHTLNDTQYFVMHAARLNLPGSVARVLLTCIDISERKRAEEVLRDLGGRLIAAQEEERSRIARELHDDLNQRMAVLSIELEQLGQRIQIPPNLRRDLEKLQLQAQEVSADIHRLSYKLHPSKLDHLGLGPAVKSLCQEISESGKLNVEFQESGLPANLAKDTTLCVFRIAQEALRNCVKHSGARSAKVVLGKSNNAIRLTVLDDGCGFDTKSNVMKNGLGFISMKERLHFVSGDIHIYSQPFRGTRIEVSVPLAREHE